MGPLHIELLLHATDRPISIANKVSPMHIYYLFLCRKNNRSNINWFVITGHVDLVTGCQRPVILLVCFIHFLVLSLSSLTITSVNSWVETSTKQCGLNVLLLLTVSKVSLRYNIPSNIWVAELPLFWERITNSACRLFIL